jgi:hypothetical protein
MGRGSPLAHVRIRTDLSRRSSLSMPCGKASALAVPVGAAASLEILGHLSGAITRHDSSARCLRRTVTAGGPLPLRLNTTAPPSLAGYRSRRALERPGRSHHREATRAARSALRRSCSHSRETESVRTPRRERHCWRAALASSRPVPCRLSIVMPAFCSRKCGTPALADCHIGRRACVSPMERWSLRLPR